MPSRYLSLALISMVLLATLQACSKADRAPSAVASIDVASIVRTAPPPPPSSAVWGKLRQGLQVYVGSDGGDATTMSVCPSIDDYENSADDCKHIRQGTPAIVDDVVAGSGQSASDPSGAPHVKLRATDGSWSGYTTAILLQGVVPLGTVVVAKQVNKDAAVILSPKQDSDVGGGIALSDGASLKILHFYPATQNRDLYVEVLNGDHRGQNGWVFGMDVMTTDGYMVPDVTYEVATPAPTTDPMTRAYTLTDSLRAFDDLNVCKAGFNAMHDKQAYQQLKDAVSAGQYHDFPKGTNLHIASDPDPNDLWVIVIDDSGNQGCVSRYNLPGYVQ